MPHLDEGTLTALFDGELAGDERDLTERHLADCGECRRLYEEIRAFAGEAGSLVDSLQPERLAPPAASRGTARPNWERLRPLAWAATLVIAAGLGWSASTIRFNQRPAALERGKLAVPTMSAVPDEKSADEQEPAGARQDEAPQRPLARPAAPAPATADAAKAAAPAPPAETDQALANQAIRSESAAPAAAPAGRLDAQRGARAAEAAALRDAPSPAAGFREAPLEEAVRALGGSVKLIDGMNPTRVQLGQPDGAADGTAAALVRITYLDPPGRELWLDQQRSPNPAEGQAAPAPAASLLAGDTVVSTAGGGRTRVRWLSPDGFRLTLTGYLSGDSLRVLVRRVR